MTAVLDLASRCDVDEVVVIISNRCRHIPGVTKALDADVARRVWEIYLKGIPNVQIELAPHTAVHHALGYFDRVDAGDTLLFCIGEADLAQGDDRFTKLLEQTHPSGVAAELIALPTGAMTVRSTALRTMLARDATGRGPFMAALPRQLDNKQREETWAICCGGMREMSEIISKKVHAVIEENNLGKVRSLDVARGGKMDPVFRVRLKNGCSYFVKYAGDTVETGRYGERLSPKPRGRLSTERRTLNRLSNHRLDGEVDLPEVVLFDKKTLTLVLTEVCPGGRSLLNDFKKGLFDPSVASAASRFLAGCHNLSTPIKPVRGEYETDLSHWERLLDLRTVDILPVGISEKVRRHMEALRFESDQVAQKKVGHHLLILDYFPKNIFVGKHGIGIIDFELSSSIGDPAYDFGLFLGHYILWGLVTSSGSAGIAAIREALKAYQDRVGDMWLSICPRVVAFAGAALFYQLSNDRHNYFKDFESCLMSTGAALLLSGIDQSDEIGPVLSRAISNRLVLPCNFSGM